MAIFFPPPPPFQGGRQPLEGREGSPGIPGSSVDAPVPVHPGREASTDPLIAASQAPSPAGRTFEGGQQPYAPARLAPSIMDVPVNDPPFQHPGTDAITASIIRQWDPRWYWSTGAEQTPQPGAAADNPPFGEPDVWDLAPILGAWAGPPRPEPQRLLSPGIPGQSVDPPPPTDDANEPWTATVLAAWRAPDPAPPLPKQNAPGIPGQSVDAPVPNLAAIEPAILVAFIPPAPAPILPRQLSPAIPGQSVDATIAVHPGRLALTNPLVIAWQPRPPDPFEGGRQPLEPARLSAGVPGMSVDPPPVRVSAALGPTVLVGWIPPPPMPTPQRLLSPAIPGQSIDNPIRVSAGLALIDVTLLAHRPPPPMPEPQRKVPPAVAAVAVNDPIFGARYDGLAILVAWLPAPPAPIVSAARFLPPPAAVNEPPYSSRRDIGVILTAWIAPPPLPVLPEQLLQPTVVAAQVPGPSIAALMAVLYPANPILLPQLRGLLDPGIPGQSADAPPPRRAGGVQPLPAPPPPPLPDVGRPRSAAAPGASVDDPPRLRRLDLSVSVVDFRVQMPKGGVQVAISVPRSAPWLDAVLAAWRSSWAPQQRRVFYTPQAPRDDPPFSGRDRLGPILVAWRPAPPMPIVGRIGGEFGLAALAAGARYIIAGSRLRLAIAGARVRDIIAPRRLRMVAAMGAPIRKILAARRLRRLPWR